MNKVMLYCLGLGLSGKTSYSVADRFLGFLTLVPLIFLLLTPINAASAVVLSIKGYPPWDKAVLGLLTVALAGWGINTVNHYVDRGRDKALWPERPLPSGRVQPGTALASAIFSLGCALLLSWFFFTMTNFFILLAAIILGILYSVYLRDTVGYLSLPPIVGLISLGGWTAFSAETLFTTWLPWYLYLLHFFWQAAHIMVYYPLHMPGDIALKRNIAVPAAFFFTPSAKSAVAIGIGFLSLTLLLSILLPLLAQPQLGYLYLVLIAITGVYALMSSVTFWRDVSDAKKGLRAFTSLSVFRLVTVVAILLDTIFPGLKVQM